MTGLLEAVFNGLSLSSILILAALGLGVTFGVMRVINMAHGEMIMLGAYTGYVVTSREGFPTLVSGLGRFINQTLNIVGIKSNLNWQTDTQLEFHLFLAIPIAFLVVALVGYFLEKGLIRFLYGRPLDTLLATWGVGLVLQQVILLIFGGFPKDVRLPDQLQPQTKEEVWKIMGATVPQYRVFIIGFTILCLFLVYLLFFYTSLGLKIRAVTQNRMTASAMGISTRQVDGWTFAFGTGLAGVAGCILGGMYNVVPNIGSEIIVEAFIVVILGGMGHFSGVVFGGLVVGVGRSVLEKFYANDIIPDLFPKYIVEVFSPIAKMSVLVLVIGFIMIRPSGLVQSKERVYD
jgi:urea transport system permease protein